MATKTKIIASEYIDANGDKTTKGVLTNRLGMLKGKLKTVGQCASVPAYRNEADADPKMLFIKVDKLVATFKKTYTDAWKKPLASGSAKGGKTKEQKAKELIKMAEELGMSIG
jgi:hypothetical protein